MAAVSNRLWLRKVRKEVYLRDGFRCVKCGWQPAEVPEKEVYTGVHTLRESDRMLTLDHVVPKSKGGKFRKKTYRLCVTAAIVKKEIKHGKFERVLMLDMQAGPCLAGS
jgi:hypothetical protein